MLAKVRRIMSSFVSGLAGRPADFAVCEEMAYDGKGVPREKDFHNYHIFQSHEMPDLQTIFIETFEPTHPFGVKAVAEIPMDGIAPAVANALLDASLSLDNDSGINIDHNPITPEKIWRAIKTGNKERNNPIEHQIDSFV